MYRDHLNLLMFMHVLAQSCNGWRVMDPQRVMLTTNEKKEGENVIKAHFEASTD